jgi:hypothetical protein
MMKGDPIATNTVCPFCEAKFECVSSLSNTGPRPRDGDFSICIDCGEWMVFDNRMENGMRKPFPDEYEVLGTHSRCRAVKEAWTKLRPERQ